MEEVTGSEVSFSDVKKKPRLSQLKRDYPELFRGDFSNYASFTDLTLPYPVVCRLRYLQWRRRIRNQFLREIALMEAVQTNAFDSIKVHRIFSEGFKLPKPRKMPNPFTPAELRRVASLLEDGRKLG